MTFRVTCVVLRMLCTHFVKVACGIASRLSRCTGVFGFARKPSAAFKTSIDSNQKKQVIYTVVSTACSKEALSETI